MPNYEQVGWLIRGQEEVRDEATGYTQRSWPTTEVYACGDCGALVFDRAKHDTIVHVWERPDEVRVFDGLAKEET